MGAAPESPASFIPIMHLSNIYCNCMRDRHTHLPHSKPQVCITGSLLKCYLSIK